MHITFWGVRGSIPTPGENTVNIGGNTSCIEIMNDDKELLIIDAGTGIRELGNTIIREYIPKYKINECSILITHTHWDHIQGFPFFSPIYLRNFSVNIYGPTRRNKSLKDLIGGQMNYEYYPIKLSDLRANIEFKEINQEFFKIGNYSINTILLNHPIKTLGYRINYKDKTIATCYDHEIYRSIIMEDNPLIISQLKVSSKTIERYKKVIESKNNEVSRFISNCNLAVIDSQFTSNDYYNNNKKGWGHGPVETILSNITNTNKIVLFHHDPNKSDKEIRKTVEEIGKYLKKDKNKELNLIIAEEQLRIIL
ncbi:MAG TPA: MBL fold metallo-hydrolase [Spirochaetota bacterium]|nr:MBL fold metallo-hydrolase [Spirochaetota bacterium]HOM38466.1 MBL fold metallo-hydrolase [Spirochaetota bacterium]HPQ49006.1 MBL fold metallo-hydrolase [Spirochaetota bacterium]